MLRGRRYRREQAPPARQAPPAASPAASRRFGLGRALPLLLAIGALSACGSRSLLQRAETLTPGDSRLSVGFFGGFANDGTNMTPSGGMEIDYRVGLTDGIDMSARIWPVGGRLSAKFRLAQSGGAVVSTEVGILGSGFPNKGTSIYYVGAQASLLLGVALGEHELVIAGLLSPGYGSASDTKGQSKYKAAGFVVEGGGAVGVDFKLGRVVHLMPEVGVFARGGEQRDVQSMFTLDPIVFNGSLSLAFEF